SLRSWRTVLRLLWGFFAAGAGAVSVDSAAANAPDVGCSDATGEGGSARAVSVEAGFVAGGIIGGGGRGVASWRAGAGGGGGRGRGGGGRFWGGGRGGRRLGDNGHHRRGCGARGRCCTNRLGGGRSRCPDDG